MSKNSDDAFLRYWNLIMTDAQKNHVEQVAAKFGPFMTDFARAIDVPYTTANSWLKRGSIPKWYHPEILRIAESLGIKLEAHELNKPA